MGHFLQSMVNLFSLIGDAFKGIFRFFKGEKSETKGILKNAFAKENLSKWLYFIPVILIIIMGVLIFVSF